MRDMVAITLRGAGFEVTEAEDGQKALLSLRSVRVDLIITDLNMPNMHGVSLIRSVRADAQHRVPPILMLTTEGGPEKKPKAARRERPG
jgi:two-component system chemotaxis response regulator CheY